MVVQGEMQLLMQRDLFGRLLQITHYLHINTSVTVTLSALQHNLQNTKVGIDDY